MIDYVVSKLRSQAAVLKDVLQEYPYSTVSSAIGQIESRIKEIEKQNT